MIIEQSIGVLCRVLAKSELKSAARVLTARSILVLLLGFSHDGRHFFVALIPAFME